MDEDMEPQLLSVDDIKYGLRRQYFERWKFPNDVECKIRVDEQHARILGGRNLSPEFISECLVCMYAYTLQTNDKFAHDADRLSNEEVRRVSCHYACELIYKLFKINLQDESAWVGISPLHLMYYNMVLLSTRDSAFFKRYNLQQKIADCCDAKSTYTESAESSEPTMLKSPSTVIESELKPVLTKKTHSRLSLLMKKKKS